VGEEPAATWNVDFYREDDGSFPVRAWLDDLPEEARGKVIARVDLLKKGGPAVDFPYTSQIEGRLREARLRMGKTRYRVLYFFDRERTAILLHGFTKKTAAIEEADKRVGRTRMAKHEARLAAMRAGRDGKQRGKRGV